MALCDSAAQYIGKVEMKAITIDNPLERMDFYNKALTEEFMRIELDQRDFQSARDYLEKRMGEQKALISSRSLASIRAQDLKKARGYVDAAMGPLPKTTQDSR